MGGKPLKTRKTALGTTLTDARFQTTAGTPMTGETAMTSFKLRNTHRYKALAFAVERIDSKRTNPMYKRREIIVDEIVSRAWAILKEASLDHDGFADFLASGIARQTDEIDLGVLAPLMVGRYGMHSGVSIWPAVMEKIQRGTFLSFDPNAKSQAKAIGQVVSFERLNGANILPHASLLCALSLRARADRADLPRRQAAIQKLIDDDLKAVTHEIVSAFADLPDIAEGIARCDTSQDLIAIFPAAENLFDDVKPAMDATRAQQVLAAL
jgi:hypothetical protein